MKNQKLKLIISSVNLDYGGIEKSLLNLLNSIDYNKYDVTLVLEEKKGVFLNKLNLNVNIIEFNVSNDKNVIKRKLTNLIRRFKWNIKNHNKYDISICYATYSMPANFIARSSSKRRIMWIHSNYAQTYDYDEVKIKAFYDIRKLNKYQSLIFVSNESRLDLIKYYPDLKEKSLVINNLVDIDEIIKNSELKLDLKFNYEKIGVFIGRIDDSVKKINRIIKLAEYCSLHSKNVGFIIVGNGPDMLNLKLEVNNLGLKNVLFVGEQPNPYPYLKKADFLILTSKYEGFPVVYNEAIILNKPILTTIDVSDDEINIKDNYGIIATKDNLHEKIDEIIKFKNKKINFKEINEKRIIKIEKLIRDVYEKNKI